MQADGVEIVGYSRLLLCRISSNVLLELAHVDEDLPVVAVFGHSDVLRTPAGVVRGQGVDVLGAVGD